MINNKDRQNAKYVKSKTINEDKTLLEGEMASNSQNISFFPRFSAVFDYAFNFEGS